MIRQLWASPGRLPVPPAPRTGSAPPALPVDALPADAQSESKTVRTVSSNSAQKSEEGLRAIFEQAAVGIAEIETQTGRFVRINRRYCDIVGLDAEEMTATTFMAITHPDDLQADLGNMERLKAGEIREFSMEKRYSRPDGEVVWVKLTVSPMWRVGEEPSHHIAVVEDITGRKRAEEALRQSEERLRRIVESVTDAIVTIDASSRIVAANHAAAKLFGYPRSELVGRPLTILMPEPLRAAHRAAFGRYAETGNHHTAWQGLQIGLHRNGTEIPLEISFGHFGSGEKQMFTAVLRDVSERMHEIERLQRAASEKETLEKLAELMVKLDSGLVLEEVLEHMFESFKSIVPYERMGCALIDEDGETARSVWARSTLQELHIPVGYSARLEGSSLRAVLDSSRPRILNDLEAYLQEHPDSENTRRIVAEGMRSSLTCPLVAMGRPVGVLFFSSTRPHTYHQVHIDIYLRIAEHISLIVEKGRLYQELAEAKREVEVRNRWIEEVFGRYTSQAIVSRLLQSPKAMEMGGETRRVTILFSDLRGFSRLSTSLGPQRVVRLLNIHLGAMAEVIMAHGGTIDEFLGDAILAIFGAPILAEDDARRALTCAIAMQNAMGQVNENLSQESLPALEMGIAVHTGDVVAGNIGSHRRAKYGVVGPAVNLVTEMEAFAAGGQILCSEDTLREVGGRVECDEGRRLRFKGVDESVRILSVRGLRDPT